MLIKKIVIRRYFPQCCGSETIFLCGSGSHFALSFGSGSGSYLTCKKFRIQLRIRPSIFTLSQCQRFQRFFHGILQHTGTGTFQCIFNVVIIKLLIFFMILRFESSSGSITSSSGSCKKFRILADPVPDPQHWFSPIIFTRFSQPSLFLTTIIYSELNCRMPFNFICQSN
jgi:hypothetical protein